MQTWQRKRTFIIEHHLWAAVLWRTAALRDITHKTLGGRLELSQTSVQYALTGKTNLTIDRAVALGKIVGLSRQSLATEVTVLEADLRRDHGDLEVITAFPSKPPKEGERLLRAFQIEEMMDGTPWSSVFGEGTVEPDAVWRARSRRGWSRETAAQKFGVVTNTLAHWECVSAPPRRWEHLRAVYGALLR